MKLVMAAAMFVCMRKVEVQAATPSVAGPKQMAGYLMQHTMQQRIRM